MSQRSDKKGTETSLLYQLFLYIYKICLVGLSLSNNNISPGKANPQRVIN